MLAQLLLVSHPATKGIGASAFGPTRKDVVETIVSASAVLAGFALVFLGLALSTIERLLSDAAVKSGESEKIGFVKKATAFFAALFIGFQIWFFIFLMISAAAAFLLGVVSSSLGVIWLIIGYGYPLYIIVLVSFFAEAVALVAIAFAVTWLLWQGFKAKFS